MTNEERRTNERTYGPDAHTYCLFYSIRFVLTNSLLHSRLSFSFGRALQASCLAAWSGRDVAGGQAELLRRAEINGAAALGQYGGGAGGAAGQQSNFVQKHTY